MVHACCVAGCHNLSHDRRGKRIANGVRFFSFPAWKQKNGAQVAELTKRRRMAWVAAVRRADVTFDSISRHKFVCSRHFHAGKPAYEMLHCHPDWVPSLHLGHMEVKATDTERFNRRSRRQQALRANNTAPATPPRLAGHRSEMGEAAPSGVAGRRSRVNVAGRRSRVDKAAPPGVAAHRSRVDVAGQRSQVDEAAPPVVAAHRSRVDEAAPPDVAVQRSRVDEAGQPDVAAQRAQVDEAAPTAVAVQRTQVDVAGPCSQVDEAALPDVAVQRAQVDEAALQDVVVQRAQVDVDGQCLHVGEAAPPDVPAQEAQVDEAAPQDVVVQRAQVDVDGQCLQVDDGVPPDVAARRAHGDTTGEQQECSFCSRRQAEMKQLLEENRILKEELSQKKTHRLSLNDDGVKVGNGCFEVIEKIALSKPAHRSTRLSIAPPAPLTTLSIAPLARSPLHQPLHRSTGLVVAPPGSPSLHQPVNLSTSRAIAPAEMMHPSIIKTGSQLVTTTHQSSKMGCPLCPKFITTRGKTIWRHLDVHIKNAVRFQDTIICRCNLSCRDTGHYHCPYCAKTIMRKEDMALHVTGCQRTSDAVPRPCEPSSLVRPPPVPPSAGLSPPAPSSLLAPCASQEIPAHPPTLPKPHSEPHPPPSALEDSVASVVTLDHPYTLPPSASVVNVDHSYTASLQFPGVPPRPCQPPSASPSASHAASAAAQSGTADLPSSRVTNSESAKCPHCSVVLYEKNLLSHIQRKHATPQGITAASHLKSVCVDRTRGLFAIQKGSQGFSVPIHVQHKRWGKQHVTQCEMEDCRQHQLLAQRSGLSHALCEHIRSLCYCSTTATEEALRHDVLEEMPRFKFFGESKVAACKKRQKAAEEACAPLSVLVEVGASPKQVCLSVHEPKAYRFCCFGRVMVTYNRKKHTWHCPCAKTRTSCLHKNIAKWHLFQTRKELFL